jgi:vacuolar-type H+-ATPase subunit H
MAGEAILKIKEKEKEAKAIINEANDQAHKTILSAEEKTDAFIREKDELLKAEEEQIRQKYSKEIEEAMRILDEEERKGIEEIDRTCGAHIEKVGIFISEAIVKE